MESCWSHCLTSYWLCLKASVQIWKGEEEKACRRSSRGGEEQEVKKGSKKGSFTHCVEQTLLAVNSWKTNYINTETWTIMQTVYKPESVMAATVRPAEAPLMPNISQRRSWIFQQDYHTPHSASITRTHSMKQIIHRAPKFFDTLRPGDLKKHIRIC